MALPVTPTSAVAFCIFAAVILTAGVVLMFFGHQRDTKRAAWCRAHDLDVINIGTRTACVDSNRHAIVPP